MPLPSTKSPAREPSGRGFSMSAITSGAALPSAADVTVTARPALWHDAPMMTIETAHCKTETSHSAPGIGCGRALNAEGRAPDWIVFRSMPEPICRLCGYDDPLKEEGSWAEPDACAVKDAVARSGDKMAPVLTGPDAVCGFADYATGTAGEAPLSYDDRQDWLMLSQAFGQHMRRPLARDRNRLGGR
jgi:hypothetical protein